MAVYTWPTARAFVAARQELVMQANNLAATSPLSGYVQTSSLPGARWGWIVTLPLALASERPAVEAFIARMSGQEHRTRLWDFKRPAPRGSINRTGVTASAAAQFAETLTLNGCGANTTLLAGDWLAVGGQLFMAAVEGLANGSGVMSIEVRHMTRAAIAGGSAVTLVQPTSLYILADSRQVMMRRAGFSEPEIELEFREVFA
jgi:hypothetical protein